MLSLFEIFLRSKGYDLSKADCYLKKIQAMPENEFESWKSEKKWDILKWHYENTPAFRQHVSKLPTQWEEIPITQKKDLQKPLKELLASPYRLSNVYISNTSGSSGHPFYFAKDRFCHALTWAQIKLLYAQHGLSFRSRQARFYGIPLSGRSRIIELSKDRLMNRRRFSVFDLSDEALSRWLKIFQRKSFDYLYGYTSSMVMFARYCMAQQIVLKEICPSLSVCITTSEVCTPEDRKILETGFGVSVVNEYGASECGLLAFEDASGQWRLCEELLNIEIVDDDNMPVPEGKAGRILVTALFNKAMPFIRYEIGDVGIVKSLPSGQRILIELQGRTNDFVKLPSGKTAPGLTFYYVSRSLLEQAGFIKEFIIVQTSHDTLQFQISATRKILKNDVDLIRKKVEEYLEPGLKVEVIEVNRINRPASGKLKHFYNCMA